MHHGSLLPVRSVLHLVAILEPVLVLIVSVLQVLECLHIFDFIKYLAKVLHEVDAQGANVLEFYKLK